MFRATLHQLLVVLAMAHLSLGFSCGSHCKPGKPGPLDKLGVEDWTLSNLYCLFFSAIIFFLPFLPFFIQHLAHFSLWLYEPLLCDKYRTLKNKIRWSIVTSSVFYAISCSLKCVVIVAAQSTKHPNPVKTSFSKAGGQAVAVFFKQMSSLAYYLLICAVIYWRLEEFFPVDGIEDSNDSEDFWSLRSWKKNIRRAWTALQLRARLALSSVLLGMLVIAFIQLILAASSFIPTSASTYTSKQHWERILYEVLSHIWLVLSTTIAVTYVGLYLCMYRKRSGSQYYGTNPLTNPIGKGARHIAVFLFLRAACEIAHEILYYLAQTSRYKGKIDMDCLDTVYGIVTILIFGPLLFFTYFTLIDEREE